MPKAGADSLNKNIPPQKRGRCSLLFVGGRITVVLAVSFVILMVDICLAQQSSRENNGKGKIEFSETEFDFGYMPQKGMFSCVFVAKNIGQGVLNIVKIDPTCGCTTVPIKKAFLKPGEQTEIRVNFDSGKITGKVAKKIKVLSTDPENSYVELYIRGVVDRAPETVEISGPAVRFDKIDISRREVRIKNPSTKQSITVSVLPLPDDLFEASLTSSKLAPEHEAVLSLTLKKKSPLGQYESSVTIECNGVTTERISLPITGIGYAH